MTHYSKLVEKKIKSEKIYRGVTGFNRDTVKLVNGKMAFREYMLHPGASAVLAFVDGKVLFVDQFRYPVNKVTLELPAGKMKKGQSPLAPYSLRFPLQLLRCGGANVHRAVSLTGGEETNTVGGSGHKGEYIQGGGCTGLPGGRKGNQADAARVLPKGQLAVAQTAKGLLTG